MMPEIVRRVPEILRRCYHEEVEEFLQKEVCKFESRGPGNFLRTVTRTRTRDPWTLVLGT